MMGWCVPFYNRWRKLKFRCITSMNNSISFHANRIIFILFIFDATKSGFNSIVLQFFFLYINDVNFFFHFISFNCIFHFFKIYDFNLSLLCKLAIYSPFILLFSDETEFARTTWCRLALKRRLFPVPVLLIVDLLEIDSICLSQFLVSNCYVDGLAGLNYRNQIINSSRGTFSREFEYLPDKCGGCESKSLSEADSCFFFASS